jgi:cytochrome c556
MKRFLTAALGLLAVVTVAAATDDKTPDISTIMTKVNKGSTCIHRKVKGQLDAATVNWKDAATLVKEYKTLAEALGKNDVPKGDKASWTKLTKEYSDNVTKLADAVDKKDKSAALKAHGAISKSCKACHDEHK